MIESPEVRIFSDYINKEIGKEEIIKIEKNPSFKKGCDFSVLENKTWKMSAFSRGKELIIFFNSVSSEKAIFCLNMIFSASGYIKHKTLEEIKKLDKLEKIKFKKEALIKLYTKNSVYYFVDNTGYLAFKWCNGWSKNRSPDIVLEHIKWIDLLFKNRNSDYFNNVIVDLIMDQRFFGGIGSLLRSEILYRVTFSPFTYLRKILANDKHRKELIEVCYSVIEESYMFGGHGNPWWKNPFKSTIENSVEFNKFNMAYRNKNALVVNDYRGRKFFYHKQWAKHAIVYNDQNEFKILQKEILLSRTNSRKNSS